VRIGRQVSHPNVCRLYDLIEIDGHYCLSMEYVDGEDLSSLLARIGRLPPDKIVDIARELCAGLAAAHDKNVIHRDLKPANVMIDGKGRIRIADFGIAALADSIERTDIAGTPAYMAPEILHGHPASVASDIYALGLVLFELATGQRLYNGRSLTEIKQQHHSTDPSRSTSSLREIPDALARVIRHCLKADPDQRPPSARAVMAALPGGDAALAQSRSYLLDRAIIALLLLALGYFLIERLVLAPAQDRIAAVPDKAKSIAVLAFADLSPDQKSGYFADGIAEEILNALAKVDALKVAGRSSSFYFKGKNESIQKIGRLLGVAHVLEGSVRKQGDRVRITAQLVEVESGFRVWSEDYDGELSDVFELQEQIARSITDALRVVLDGDQQRRLVPQVTEYPEAYARYLQATAIFNRRDSRRFLRGIEQLQKAVAIDPAYARAHARLASMYAIASEYTSINLDEALSRAREHAEIAIALDPTMAEPHAAMARVHGAQRNYVEEVAAFERALKLEPNDVTANFWFGSTQFTIGYVERGNAAIDRALAREPMLPMALLWRGMSYSEAGDQDNAEKLLQRAEDVGLALVGTGWSEVAEARSDIPEATRQLAAGTEMLFTAFPAGTADAFARACYGDTVAREQVIKLLDAYLASDPAFVDGIVPYALARLGETRRALAITESKRATHPMYLALLWGPYGKATRALPEFPTFVRRIGFAAVWDKYGAPDFCQKAGNGDWRCQ